MGSKSYAKFFDKLGKLASGDDYGAVSADNFLGRYQMGERAMIDIGLVFADATPTNNDYSGGFTGKYGIKTSRVFLIDEAAQDAAIEEYMAILFGDLGDFWRFEGQVLDGTKLTISGMLAGTYLVGVGSFKTYLSSGGDTVPGGANLINYIEMLAGYHTPFSVDHSIDEETAGGSGKDVLRGFGGNDTLSGLGADDKLKGNNGDDNLFGGNGEDQVIGGSGNDWLDGGNAADRMKGGNGDDTYVLSGPDDEAIEGGGAGGGTDTAIITAAGDFNFNNIENVVVDSSGKIDVSIGSRGIDSIAFDSQGGSITYHLVTAPKNNVIDVEFGKGRDTFVFDASGFDPATGVYDGNTLNGFFWGFDMSNVGGNDRIDLTSLDIEKIITGNKSANTQGLFLMAPHSHLDIGNLFFDNTSDRWYVLDSLSGLYSPFFEGDLSKDNFLI
jgi:Ca2+-binding RTX toxin-like protein